jgi:hypothetical protein
MVDRTFATPPPREAAAHVLRLVERSARVELKLDVADPDDRPALEALGIDPAGAQVRLLHHLDTPALDLAAAGIAIRVRRDVVMTLPGEASELVELDTLPSGYACSALLRSRPDAATLRAAVRGERPAAELLDPSQRERLPGAVSPEALVVHGPILVLEAGAVPARLERLLTASLWLFPDESRVLELSTRCRAADALRVAAEARALLVAHGLELTGDRDRHARRTLQRFASA